MSLFGKLLGSDKAISIAGDTLNSGMSMLDNAFHTDEEKAAHKAKMFDNWVKFQNVLSNESSPTSLSRRVILWFIMGMVTFTLLVCTVLIIFGFETRYDQMIDLFEKLKIGWSFTAVVTTYFITNFLPGRSKTQ